MLVSSGFPELRVLLLLPALEGGFQSKRHEYSIDEFIIYHVPADLSREVSLCWLGSDKCSGGLSRGSIKGEFWLFSALSSSRQLH